MSEREVLSKMGFAETVDVLQRSAEANGLKIVSTVDAQANLRRIGVDIAGNKILEVFNPLLAKEVFDHNLRAGIVPPLRIYIYEDGGKTHVVAQDAIDLFSPYKGLEDLASRVDRIIETVLKSIM